MEYKSKSEIFSASSQTACSFSSSTCYIESSEKSDLKDASIQVVVKGGDKASETVVIVDVGKC
jgi:hypothetical protein